MHVYAPGTKYRAITVTLNRNPSLKPAKAVYPKPSIYVFKPLKEQVLVYSDPFKLTMNIAVGTVPPRTARAEDHRHAVLSGVRRPRVLSAGVQFRSSGMCRLRGNGGDGGHGSTRRHGGTETHGALFDWSARKLRSTAVVKPSPMPTASFFSYPTRLGVRSKFTRGIVPSQKARTSRTALSLQFVAPCLSTRRSTTPQAR